MKNKIMTYATICACILAGLAGFVGCKGEGEGKPSSASETGAIGLDRLVAACRMYSDDNGVYPRLDLTPGNLAMDVGEEYLSEDVDDADYVYLGYTVCSPQNVDLYLDMYKDFAEGRFVPDKDYVRPGTGQTLVRLRKGAEIYCSSKPSDPEANSAAAATIPVVLQRRENYPDKKAPVGFMDGHVESVEPGQHATVDRIYEILPQLDGFAK